MPIGRDAWQWTIAAGFSALIAVLGIPKAAIAEVRTAATEPRKAERLKTIPIGKRAWEKPRSVASLAAGRIGPLHAGDRLRATGEVQLSVCLRPNPRHPASRAPCVGKVYGFDPTIRARLVLAPDEGAAAPGRTRAISEAVGLRCTQRQPHRNHHCVVAIPWSKLTIDDPASLPCPGGSCQINLVVSASHSKARRGNKVVVGASDSRGRINQGRAKISSARFRPADEQPAKVWRSARRTRKQVPVAAKGRNHKRRVVHSVRIGNLRAGDQLLVDARVQSRIGHLPYNALTRTEVVLARKPGATQQNGRLVESDARVTARNGYNCTRGRSGHRDPCTMRKGGVLSVRRGSKGPWFVNVVVGHSAIGTAPRTRRWRSSHAGRVPKRGGWVRVERYPRGSHGGGAAVGWRRFSAEDPPRRDRPRQLVRQIARFGITEGEYNCQTRRRPRRELVCNWRASGRFGESPRYECSQRAWWRPKSRTFKLRVCKPALAAQLWHRVHMRDGRKPTYAGACQEGRNGNFACRFFHEGGCRGDATYTSNWHSWRIADCRRT